MKEVTIDTSINDIDAAYAKLPCYDGIIDGEPSWYGGLIKASFSGNKLVFMHDMPNREWESWLENAENLFGAEKE